MLGISLFIIIEWKTAITKGKICFWWGIHLQQYSSWHKITQVAPVIHFKFKFKFKICLLSIYRDTTCIQLSTLCLIYTTAQSLWNGNGACRPAANPGTAWRHCADTKAPRQRDPTEDRAPEDETSDNRTPDEPRWPDPKSEHQDSSTGITFQMHSKLTPPSICNNQLYCKMTPRVIVSWLPSHFATTGSHCKMTPHFEMTPNKQYYISYVENNLWLFVIIVFLSFMTKSMSEWHFVFEIQIKQYHWVPFETKRYYLPTMMQDNSIPCLIWWKS